MEGFCILASGSKGNCTYFGTRTTKILLDVGISVKAIEERLQQIEVTLQDIDAIFITHEHSDHIKSLFSLCRQYQIPVICNSDTAKAINDLETSEIAFRIFFTGEDFTFGDIHVESFSIQHDAVDPVAYVFKTAYAKVGVCTDLGFVTSLVRNALRDCDYLIVESNHHVSMVHSSTRPKIYKDRVLSKVGHLSNVQCRELLVSIAHADLKHVHLAHLSSECNSEQAVRAHVIEPMRELFPHIDISIAYQEKISQKISFERETNLYF